MNPEDDICPWGNEPLALEVSSLSSSQKTWLARQVINKEKSTSELSRYYSLKADTLRKYVRNHRKGISMKNSEGRPKCLDPESIQSTEDFLGHNNHVPKDQLRVKIRRENIETLIRRFPNVTEEFLYDYRMSRRSVVRYESLFVINNNAVLNV